MGHVRRAFKRFTENGIVETDNTLISRDTMQPLLPLPRNPLVPTC
jgi:hypothetical protein